ncbi:MAG: YiiX/YebB-like N1pC/P60 family cysteine hydrolase [Acidobacteriota bacterium]
MPPRLDPAFDGFQDGDLIVRRGRSLISAAVLAVDEAEYSHIGLVDVTSSGVEVVHALPEEERPIRVESVDSFLAEAEAAAVYRVTAREVGSVEPVVVEAHRHVDAGFGFDDRFELETAEAVYCTELVWRAWRRVGVDLTDAGTSRLDFLFLDGPILMISDVLEHPSVAAVHRFAQEN